MNVQNGAVNLFRGAWAVALALLILPASAQPTPAPASAPPGAPAAAPTSGIALPAPTMTVTIEEAVRLALTRNPTLEAATEAIRRAEAVVSESRSFRLPRLDGTARFALQGPIPSFTFTTPPTVPGESPQSREISLGRPFTREFSVAATYNPDPFGGLRAQTRIAQRQVNVARGGFLTVQNELVFAVQNVYLAGLRARELVGVQQEALNAAREQLRVAQAQVSAGVAPEFDSLRARVQVENVQQSLVAARSVELRALATLARALSLNPGEGVELVPVATASDSGNSTADAARRSLEPRQTEEPVPLPTSLDSALAEAFTRRPEVYSAEWVRRAADARVAFERRRRLPTLGLTAAGFYTPDVAGFAAIERSWSIWANISIPIWDAGLARARTRQAQADLRAASAQLRAEQEVVAEEIKQAVADLDSASQRRRAAASNVEQAKEALRVAGVRYTAGLAASLEVSDAEAMLTQARANEVNANYDYLASLAALNRSLGRYAGETGPGSRPAGGGS